MTIFYEVALKLISTTCEAAIVKSEETSNGLLSIAHNLKVANAKQALLKELLAKLTTLPPPANDAEGMKQLQDYLENYQERAVAITIDPQYTDKELSGTTEKMLAHLSASLHPTLFVFTAKLQLLNKEYSSRDALHHFFLLTGLYHAKRKLREQEMPTEQGITAKYLADVSPFIAGQKALVSNIFSICCREMQPWNGRASDLSYQSSRAREVLAYVYELRDLHEELIAKQPFLVTQTEGFIYYSKALRQCLSESIASLKGLWGINAAMQSKVDEGDTESLSSETPLDFARRASALPTHVREDFQKTAAQQQAARDRIGKTDDAPRGARAASFRTELDEAPDLLDELTSPNAPNTILNTPRESAVGLDVRNMPQPLAAENTVSPQERQEMEAALHKSAPGNEGEPSFVDEPSPTNLSITTLPTLADNDLQADVKQMQEQPVLEEPSQKPAQPLAAASSNTREDPLTDTDHKQPVAIPIPPQPMQEPLVEASVDGENSASRILELLGGADKLVVTAASSEQVEAAPPAQEKPKKLSKAERKQAAATAAAAATAKPFK